MQYEIVSGTSTNDLQRQVNVKIGQGWVPVGGLSCVVPKAGTAVFMQAMIKNVTLKP